MNRRNFLKGVPPLTALLGVFPASLSAIEREETPGKLERRSLGRTGEKLSILGFGGIVVMNATPQEGGMKEVSDENIDGHRTRILRTVNGGMRCRA